MGRAVTSLVDVGHSRDKNCAEYEKVSEHIHKKRGKDIIYFDFDKAKFTIKKKNIPTWNPTWVGFTYNLLIRAPYHLFTQSFFPN